METQSASSMDIYDLHLQAETGKLGLRDRNKVDKLLRISSATKELFSDNGYEGTTLRAIAQRADVALGTVTLYAKDKRELIVMLFNFLIPPLLEEAIEEIDEDAALIDNMVNFFAPFYRAYRSDKRLYLILLGQVFMRTESGLHARQNNKITEQLMDAIAQIVEIARDSGEIGPKSKTELVSKSFFYIHFGVVRLWLAEDDPVVEEGIGTLRGMFELHINGIKKR